MLTMTDWNKVGLSILRRRISAALVHHQATQWSTGLGCTTCRVLVRDEYGTRREPAPWPCDTAKALTGQTQ